MRVADADRLVVTTFDAAGKGTATSEFVVGLAENTVAVWTPHSTPWIERLAASDVVSVQAADRSGRPLREEPVFEGTAELVIAGADMQAAAVATKAKYGFAATLATAVDRAWELGGPSSPDGAVVIRLVG